MNQTLIRTPSDAEISVGIAAGKRERSAAVWNAVSALVQGVRKHFEWREDMRRIAISGRCPECNA